jgi:hypothetical protein
VARVLRCEPLTKEDVAEVSPAVVALNLDSIAVRISQTLDGCGDLIVESRPATVRVELVIGAIEFGVAAAAEVSAGLVKVIVFTP